MMVTRKAYQATGGYENMPFSVTEDFLLFHEVMKRKFGFTQIVQAKAMAFTVPAANLEDLLLQRKRWMKGAFQLPLYLVIILLLQAFMLPVLIFLFFFFPSLAVGIFLFKIIVQFAICLWMISKLKYFRLVPYLFLFEPYYSLFSLLSLLYYLWPGKILWKERQY
jgi:cellulose synthase/poly-beta-1,6-N-acetylglucosamine synthase-like glycosyltransferase